MKQAFWIPVAVGMTATRVFAGPDIAHYEYAIQNLNSHRSAAAFSVPIASGVTLSSIGFHDVDYHSGDGPGGVNYEGTDWSVTIGAGAVSWSTRTEDQNVLANALRWGTLYNFRFDADSPPTAVRPSGSIERAYPGRSPS